jgi:hypothetical protein
MNYATNFIDQIHIFLLILNMSYIKFIYVIRIRSVEDIPQNI